MPPSDAGPSISDDRFKAAVAGVPVRTATSRCRYTLDRLRDAPAGAKVAGEAGRLLQQLEAGAPAVRRGVVIDGEGDVHVIEDGDPFDLLLNDPKVAEAMKAHIRESRQKLKMALPGTPSENPAAR